MSLPATAHDVFVVGATNGIGMYTFKDYSHGCVLLGAAATIRPRSFEPPQEDHARATDARGYRRIPRP
jgi:hypothetical protein